MARGNGACVAGKAGEVGGTRVRAAYTAAGPKRLACEDAQLLPVGCVRKDAAAAHLRLAGVDVALRGRCSGNERRAVIIFNVGRVLRRFALYRRLVLRRILCVDLGLVLRD